MTVSDGLMEQSHLMELKVMLERQKKVSSSTSEATPLSMKSSPISSRTTT